MGRGEGLAPRWLLTEGGSGLSSTDFTDYTDYWRIGATLCMLGSDPEGFPKLLVRRRRRWRAGKGVGGAVSGGHRNEQLIPHRRRFPALLSLGARCASAVPGPQSGESVQAAVPEGRVTSAARLMDRTRDGSSSVVPSTVSVRWRKYRTRWDRPESLRDPRLFEPGPRSSFLLARDDSVFSWGGRKYGFHRDRYARPPDSRSR